MIATYYPGLLAAALALACAFAAAAEVSPPNDAIRMPKRWTATVAASKLKVRAGPGENYAVVETLDLGATVAVINQTGAWVRLDRPDEAWVARSFLKLPPDFLAPLFNAEDNAFLDWAAGTGQFEELSVEADGRLAVIFSRPLYGDRTKLEQVAKDTACAYRQRTKYPGPVLVTVWAADGPAAGLVHQAQCP